jgi:hypothetical protein
MTTPSVAPSPVFTSAGCETYPQYGPARKPRTKIGSTKWCSPAELLLTLASPEDTILHQPSGNGAQFRFTRGSSPTGGLMEEPPPLELELADTGTSTRRKRPISTLPSSQLMEYPSIQFEGYASVGFPTICNDDGPLEPDSDLEDSPSAPSPTPSKRTCFVRPTPPSESRPPKFQLADGSESGGASDESVAFKAVAGSITSGQPASDLSHGMHGRFSVYSPSPIYCPATNGTSSRDPWPQPVDSVMQQSLRASKKWRNLLEKYPESTRELLFRLPWFTDPASVQSFDPNSPAHFTGYSPSYVSRVRCKAVSLDLTWREVALALHASTPLDLEDTFFISGGRKLEATDTVRTSHLTAYSTVSVNFRKRGGSTSPAPSIEHLSDHDSENGFEQVDNEGVTFSPAVQTPPPTPRLVPDSMATRLVLASAAAISAATADQSIQEQQPLHSGLFRKLAILIFKVVK